MKQAIAFIFPGQGSQAIGMGREFWEQWPPARDLFRIANDKCGGEIQDLCFDGPIEELTRTENAQPAIFTVSCISAAFAVERGLHGAVMAGHSLGEYAALVAAGACDFDETLELVCERGRLMSRAASDTDGMAAVIGLPLDDVHAVLAAVPDVTVANENCPGQTVVSGSRAGIQAASRLLEEAGARRVVELAVAGAFHTERMAEANAELAPRLEALIRCDAAVPVVQNATGSAATKRGDLLEGLKAQMTSPVKWESSVRAMVEMGVSTFLELGPGNVLKGLVQRCAPEAAVVCMGEPGALVEMEERMASA